MNGDGSLRHWKPLVMDALRVKHSGNEMTVAKLQAEAARLFAYWNAVGIDTVGDLVGEVTVEWCWKPRYNKQTKLGEVSPATARNRQWAAQEVLNMFVRLGADINPAELIGERVARPRVYVSTRPLTDEEDRLVRRRAESNLARSRIGMLVGLSYCGGTATELAALRRCDIDVAERTVSFGGVSGRVNPLDGWTVEMTRRFFANCTVGVGELLCVSESTGVVRGAQSVTVRLGKVLREAGLAGRPGVSARSIRLTTGRRVLDVDGIEAAARFLGSSSLDSTAAALGHRWEHGDG